MTKTLHDLFFELYPEPSTEMDKRLTRLVIREDGWHIEFYSESEDRQGNVIAHHLVYSCYIGSTRFARAYLGSVALERTLAINRCEQFPPN